MIRHAFYYAGDLIEVLVDARGEPTTVYWFQGLDGIGRPYAFSELPFAARHFIETELYSNPPPDSIDHDPL